MTRSAAVALLLLLTPAAAQDRFPSGSTEMAQASTPELYTERCGRCHGKPAALARKSLLRRDGVLLTRRSGRPLSDFLRGHGGLKPDDVAVIVDLLAGVEREVNPP